MNTKGWPVKAAPLESSSTRITNFVAEGIKIPAAGVHQAEDGLLPGGYKQNGAMR